jgi:hypothetical protein
MDKNMLEEWKSQEILTVYLHSTTQVPLNIYHVFHVDYFIWIHLFWSIYIFKMGIDCILFNNQYLFSCLSCL